MFVLKLSGIQNTFSSSVHFEGVKHNQDFMLLPYLHTNDIIVLVDYWKIILD